jgi:hypothetical protein
VRKKKALAGMPPLASACWFGRFNAGILPEFKGENRVLLA